MRKQPFDLSGKTAIVTGGGSGIGKAIAESLAYAGADVAILDLSSSDGNIVAEGIRQTQGKARFMPCDVTKTDDIAKVFHEVTAGKSLDILINNAGIAHIGNAEATTEEDMDRIYHVNIKGVFNCLKAGIELMKDKGGSIINMGSVASLVGIADRFAYSMSKGAVHAMTLSVAKDYLAQNVRCNCIAPARIHTPFVDGFLAKNYPGREEEMFNRLSRTQPIGRMGTPEEVASLALYLCSDESSFITGICYPIDGGFTTLNS